MSQVGKATILHLLILISKFLIPATAILLKFLHPEIKYGWFLVGLVLFVSIERSWETFSSGKFEKNISTLEKDWSFQAVTLAYVFLAFIIIFEFFYFHSVLNLIITLSSGIIFLAALVLRLWGTIVLGEAWQVKSSHRPLFTNKGPYKYMRHPIYFGFILEVLMLPMIVGVYYAVLFSIFIFVPLILIKTYAEEKYLIENYGQEYKNYIKIRWAFWVLPKYNMKIHE